MLEQIWREEVIPNLDFEKFSERIRSPELDLTP